MMYTDEQFEELEQEELAVTKEALAAMLLILGGVKSNLENELRSFYQKYGKDGVITYAEARKWVSEKDHRRRLTVLLLLVSTKFDNVRDDLEREMKGFLTRVIEMETAFFDVEVDVEKVLATIWGLDATTWLIRLLNDIDLWDARVRADIKRHISRGSTIEQVLSMVDTRFDSINSVLTTLAISESTAIGSLARKSIFKSLGVNKYQFFSKPDERRCETCGALHGVVFPISAYEVGVTASPIHPRCRCWEVPILE